MQLPQRQLQSEKGKEPLIAIKEYAMEGLNTLAKIISYNESQRLGINLNIYKNESGWVCEDAIPGSLVGTGATPKIAIQQYKLINGYAY